MAGAEHSSSPEFSSWLRALGTVVETHGSWVVLSGDRALKFKKPVNLGFLDFSSREKRELLCQREVELNRRLAPSVYLGVLSLYRGPAGYVLQREGEHAALSHDYELVDHAVEMRRLDEGCRADLLLAAGRLDAAQLRQLAARLVAFHAGLPRDPALAAFGSAEAVGGIVRENFEELEPLVTGILSPREWQDLKAAQTAFLQERRDRFEARAEGGHVRDGHGDLRLEHVYFQGDDVLVVDCIEFNDRFRYADTALDVAFLSMDLRRFGRPDLAEAFLAEVAQLSGDYEAYGLIDFYESYRATVRGKVAAFRQRQLDGESSEAAAAQAESRAFLLRASTGLTKAGVPQLVCLGGLIASGKSTLARSIATQLACPHIDSDSTRKRLRGLDPWTPLVSAPFEGAYSAAETDRTYERVRDLAGIVLRSGRTTVVDASFSTRLWRQRFAELAGQRGISLAFIECSAQESVIAARLLRRAEGPSRSDGRLGMLPAFRAAYEPIEDGEFTHLLRCDTSDSGEAATDRALHFLSGVRESG